MKNKNKTLKGFLTGASLGAGVAGVGLLLTKLDKKISENKRKQEKAKLNKVIYIPDTTKQAKVAIKKDKTKEKEIKRTYPKGKSKGAKDIRGRFTSLKTAGESRDIAKMLLAGVAGLGTGFMLTKGIGTRIRKKQLNDKIDEKRKQYINNLLFNKSAGWAQLLAGQAVSPLKYLNEVSDSLPEGGKVSDKITGALLAASILGFGGAAYATKKYLDNRFSIHDSKLNNIPVNSKIILKRFNPDTLQNIEKQSEARDLYMTVLALEVEKQANRLPELSNKISYNIPEDINVMDIPYIDDPLFKQAVLHQTFYKEGTFYDKLYKEAFLPLLRVLKWRAANQAVNSVIENAKEDQEDAEDQDIPDKPEFNLDIETKDPAIAELIIENKEKL